MSGQVEVRCLLVTPAEVLTSPWPIPPRTLPKRRRPMSGARAIQRKPARKIGLTKQQTVFLPSNSPRKPPRTHIGIVAKMFRLAERKKGWKHS